ncbi:MAG: hypothetical protein J6D36_01070, partial [Erysipelotrichaceae bacterium]|nr:hypothetical protein [Erysipelotrichaceae bacterium]
MIIKGITTDMFKRFSSIDAGAATFAFTVSIAGAAATVVADRLLIQRNEITKPIHFLIVGICAFFLAVILYALARRLYLVTDRNSLCTPKECFSFKRMKPRFFLLNWGLILLCWMPWFIARFPGGYIWDTLLQLLEVYGFKELSNHNPVFTTFVFGTFWHVGDLTGTHAWSCALWAILSMSITAATFSLFLSYLRFLGVKKKVVVAATIYFALFIPLPLFAMTIMKDSYFAWGWIPFLICCIEIIRTRGQCLANRGILVALFLIGIHLVLTKQTGIYIVVLSLLVLCFLRQKKRSRLSIVFMMVLVLCTNAGWLGFASSALGTTVSGGDYSEEMASVPSQQVGLLVATHSDDLTNRDWDVLEKVYVRPKQMAKDY